MAANVRTKLIRIGNSQGLRIPKLVLEQAGLREDVEISVEGEQLVIRNARRPREGWGETFRAMSEAGDDRLDDYTPNEFDQHEWEWK